MSTTGTTKPPATEPPATKTPATPPPLTEVYRVIELSNDTSPATHTGDAGTVDHGQAAPAQAGGKVKATLVKSSYVHSGTSSGEMSRPV